ncbi:MAG: H4MPT-linked C1 transfer pathway protein [Methylococcaceae bacterium]|nr:H4MPT-linked C1 transfer pathway protein [Methylococcaceae bacterium]
MQNNIMGWDIGGAHLKASIIQAPDVVKAIYQRPCPLWKGIDKLEEAVREILSDAALPINLHVLTMTGELVDLFEGRDDGVKHILAAMDQFLVNSKVIVYAGLDGFIEIADVKESHYLAIASANWLASATWAAQKIGNGLFVDVGSTTTDILLLNKGKVLAEGYTDYQRLISQELVYTGIVRTAVMSVAQSAQDGDKEVGLMAEYFATMADVYRLNGELTECHDQCDTADGAEKTVAASAKRLARMIGCDYSEAELPRWQNFASHLRRQQVARIRQACTKQLSRKAIDSDSPLIGAGIGSFLVEELAANLGRPYIDFSGLFTQQTSTSTYSIKDCAPAVALACLALD